MKKHVTLRMLFSASSSSLPQLFRNMEEFRAKKIIYRSSDSQCNSVLCCYERKFFWSILFLYKSQQRGIPQRLLDKCSHLFIWTLLKQTSSSTKNLLKWHDDIRKNSSCCNVLLWASFCFLEVSQQKHVGMVSINNV